MKHLLLVLVIGISVTFVISFDTIAAAESNRKPVAVVRTKAGNEYTFLGGCCTYELQFHIEEHHIGNKRVTEGIFYHYEDGDISSNMFHIDVDMGDFTRNISPKEVN